MDFDDGFKINANVKQAIVHKRLKEEEMERCVEACHAETAEKTRNFGHPLNTEGILVTYRIKGKCGGKRDRPEDRICCGWVSIFLRMGRMQRSGDELCVCETREESGFRMSNDIEEIHQSVVG